MVSSFARARRSLDGAHQCRRKGKELDNESKQREPLSNLINRMPEFERFDAEGAERWTLPMAAAWFIWRSYEAVHDQWRIATGRWKPFSSGSPYSLGLQPGTLGCVFRQADFSNGQRRFISLEDFGTPLPPETTSPYDRLRHALRFGKLRSIFVWQSIRGGESITDCDPAEWFDFDNLADPADEQTARSSIASYPEECAVLVSREEAIGIEAQLSAAEHSDLFGSPNRRWAGSRTEGIGASVRLDGLTCDRRRSSARATRAISLNLNRWRRWRQRCSRARSARMCKAPR